MNNNSNNQANGGYSKGSQDQLEVAVNSRNSVLATGANNQNSSVLNNNNNNGSGIYTKPSMSMKRKQ